MTYLPTMMMMTDVKIDCLQGVTLAEFGIRKDCQVFELKLVPK